VATVIFKIWVQRQVVIVQRWVAGWCQSPGGHKYRRARCFSVIRQLYELSGLSFKLDAANPLCYLVIATLNLRKSYYKNNRRTKETGEQKQQRGWGLNIAVTHHFDISGGSESAILFFHAIVLFAIVLKLLSYDCTFCIILSLKYMRTLTFLIVNITLNPEHVSSTLWTNGSPSQWICLSS